MVGPANVMRKLRMKSEPKLDGFSIVETCHLCVNDDLCDEHYDEREARLINQAYSLVEQNLMEQEGHSYHRDNEAEPSAHEWVGSVTRRNEKQQNLLDAPETREEFLEPTYNLADRLSGYRFLGKHMIDLRDDYDVRLSLVPDKGFGTCQACHMLYNQALATCPEC